MHEFWYDYLQTVSLYTKREMIFIKDIAEDKETRYDASNFELDRPLSKRKNNWLK